MSKNFPSVVIFFALVIAIILFGVWFKNTANKVLAKCTAVELVLGDKCEGGK